MYRHSNDRYSENSQINSMNSYPPPIPNIPKMHNHIEGYNPPPIPYYENPQPFEFVPPQPPNPGS